MSKVEWKRIWELTTWDKRFQGVDKSMQVKVKQYPYLLAKDLFALSVPNGDVKLLSTGVQEGWTTEKVAGKYLCEGEIVSIPWGKSPGAKNPVKYYNGKFVTGDNRIATSSDTDVLNNKFLYYWFIRNSDLLDTFYRGAGIQHPSMYMVLTMYIPLLPISEQNRIVDIFDTFTASIDNLKEQIAQRRKQYEYYRDQLLDLEGKDEKDILSWGEFCKMTKGNGVQKVDFVDEGVGCIHYGQIYTHYGSYTYTTNKFVSQEVFENAKKASKGDIVMTDTSENVEDICKSVAYLGEEDIAVSNHALIIKHKQNPKFLSFSTQTNCFFLQKRKVVYGVKVSGIKPEHLSQIKIYLPSIEKQNEIVDILDKFEASILNLEAQLCLREKQYEYYRNKLLTFE